MRFLFFFIFISTTVLGQDKPLVTLDGKMPEFNKMADVLPSQSQNFLTRGVKVTTMSFNKNDTIYYTLSRKFKRKSNFSISDSEVTLLSVKFQPKNSLLTGSFVVKEDATLLLKIFNQSYLGNEITLALKKKTYVAPADVIATPKMDTTIVYYDSLIKKLDTLVYLACTLNLNQSHSFTLDSIFEKSVYCAVLNSFKGVVSFVTTSIDTSSNMMSRVCSNTKYQSDKSTSSVIIYTSDTILKQSNIDSLTNLQSKNIEMCFFDIPSNTLSQQLKVSNLDKVVGIYVRIQCVEIKKNTTVIIKEIK